MRTTQEAAMNKNGAWFKATRIRLGISQQEAADALDTTTLSIKRWESPEHTSKPSDDAVLWMEKQERKFIGEVKAITYSKLISGVSPVELTYYASDAQQRLYGLRNRTCDRENAISQEAAARLIAAGIEVNWVYPEQRSKAIDISSPVTSGQAVRYLIESSGMSVTDTAEAISVPKQSLSDILCGKANIKAHKLSRVCSVSGFHLCICKEVPEGAVEISGEAV